MKPSKDLLQSLENKLKAANIRSPYLNATVGRSRNKFDFKDLDLLTRDDEAPLSDALLTQLTNTEQNGKTKMTLAISSGNVSDKSEDERFKMDVLIKRLQSIHFDQEEDFLEHGTKSFGFGYPLLAIKSKQDKNRTIIAPLLIWYMDLSTLPNNHHAYEIERTTDHPIIINPQLTAFLGSDQGLMLDKIPEEYLDDECISEEELSSLIDKISKLVGAELVDNEGATERIKEKDYYDKMIAEKPLIFKSGVFSLFKSNKESIVSDYQNMLQGMDDMMFDNPELYRPYQEDYFASVQLDPSQESILRNISEHKKVIIQGPPGTGKSNSLSGIIINALENKAKVLVVCEKKTALDVLFENLSEKGLEEFCAVIDNVNSDRQKLVRMLRDRLEDRKYEADSGIRLSEYLRDKQSFISTYQAIQTKYGNLLTKVMGDLSWKDVVGNYLKAKRGNGDKEIKIIPPNEFLYDQDTFFQLIDQVNKARSLKEELGSLSESMNLLNIKLFAKELSTARLRTFISRLQENKDILDKVIVKANKLEEEIGVEKLQNYQQASFITKLLALFNGQLKNQIATAKSFGQELTLAIEGTKTIIPSSTASIENIKSAIDNAKTAVHHISQILQEKNQYREFFEFKNLYHYTLSDFERQLIDELEKHPLKDWENILRQWYLNQLLLEKEIDLGSFPTDEKELALLDQLNGQIDLKQMQAIKGAWYEIQKSQMNGRTLQEVRLLFNLRANKTYGKRNSLRTLFFNEFDLITAFFPVILINPSVCSSMLPLKPDLFDIVIFDEASQLRVEDTFPALLRGRFKVVSGDIHQMPPSTHFSNSAQINSNLEDLEDDVVFSEEESLLTYAQNSDFEFNYLDFHYRSRHPHLIDFSNAAFYGKRLVPMPPSYHEKPLELREVNGVYEDNANDDEANEIIKILFEEIKADEKGNYPSIGVATLNTTQQRYIWEKIWDKTDADEAARAKLSKLEEAGFFIKNLENIQGDQRDIIIISTTFGKRKDGSFIQNFGPLNRDKGYKLLNVIVTRAKNKVVLVTSIPSEFYNNFRSDIITKGNTGKGIFYAYINYVKFCDEGNEAARVELLNFLMEDKTEEAKPTVSADNFVTESVFEEEVIHELLGFVPEKNIITQFQLGGFRLDIVIKDQNDEPKIVIECDGKAYHSSKVAYRYDLHRQKIIERYGLKVYRIWSTNWWRNKDRETKKLSAYISEHIKEF